MRKNIKIFILIAVLMGGFMVLNLLGLFSPFGDASDYHSTNIYLYDMTNDRVIFKKDASERVYPASLTKIMSVFIALENIEDVTEKVKIDVESYKRTVATNSSMTVFFGKEVVTINDLLYGTLLASGGEAANTLAIETAGSGKDFVDLMNNKVLELDLKNTHFINVDGMHDPNQYTTAEDTAIILKTALENEKFRDIFTSSEYVTSASLDHPRGIKVESTVLSKIYPQEEKGFKVLGGKSGTTPEAGLNWATLIEKDGKQYICIVMGAPLDNLKDPTLLQKEDTLKLAEKIK